MCSGCWEEAGKPRIDNEKVRAAVPLAQAVYETEHGGAGGWLHIMLDDWNVDDESVAWLKTELPKKVDATDAERSCLAHFEQLTVAERYSALALFYGFLKA